MTEKNGCEKNRMDEGGGRGGPKGLNFWAPRPVYRRMFAPCWLTLVHVCLMLGEMMSMGRPSWVSGT